MSFQTRKNEQKYEKQQKSVLASSALAVKNEKFQKCHQKFQGSDFPRFDLHSPIWKEIYIFTSQLGPNSFVLTYEMDGIPQRAQITKVIFPTEVEYFVLAQL